MTFRDEFAARVRRAYLHLNSQIGEQLTLQQIADRVTRAHGARILSISNVSGYKSGESMPPLDVVLAMARACGVDPLWLAFGPGKDPVPATSMAIEPIYKQPPSGKLVAVKPAAKRRGAR